MADVMTLWPKWAPASLAEFEGERVRDVFAVLASEHIDRHGSLMIRRRDGAFVCDLPNERL